MDDTKSDVRDFSRRSEFSDEGTQPLTYPASFDDAPRLFDRLAEALDVSSSALELLLSELLAYVDATPETLGAAELWDLRVGLFELVDNVLPAAQRERSRSCLVLLLLDVAPVASG
jgi:hypothetical protein